MPYLHQKWLFKTHYKFLQMLSCSNKPYSTASSRTHHILTPSDIPSAPPHTLPAPYITSGSVYVHWPYCRQRCSYCNFVKFVPRAGTPWTLPHEVLEDALAGEVRHSLQHSHITRVSSVFFGGGTPSLARPNMVEKVLSAIQREGQLKEGAEVTLEVNPTSLETHTLRDFKEAGVNRVSIGVQSLDAATLKQLHRDHSVAEAVCCLDTAHSLFPGRVSMDLMFGLPGHSTERWAREVEEAVKLCGDHMSLYQLTVERGTALHSLVNAGEVQLPDQDQMADLYEVALQVLEEAGLYRYEVSNFARHRSAESSHNKSYWQGKQYVGVGPGAHSRVVPLAGETSRDVGSRSSANDTRNSEMVAPSGVLNSASVLYSGASEARAQGAVPGSTVHSATTRNTSNRMRTKSAYNTTTSKKVPDTQEDGPHVSVAQEVIREARVNAADPASWLRETQAKGNGTRRVEAQTRLTAATEYLASGLRTSEGVTEKQWSVFLPCVSLREVFGTNLGWLEDSGLVCLSPRGLKATREGLAVLDAILPHLYNILQRHLT